MMKKNIHSIALETFIYPSEDSEKVRKAARFVFSADELSFDFESLESIFGPEIIKATARISKAGEIKAFVDGLKRLSKKESEEIISTIRERTDSEGNVFLRFSKQDAFGGVLKLLYSGDVIKVKVKMATYPVSSEEAGKSMVRLIEGLRHC